MNLRSPLIAATALAALVTFSPAKADSPYNSQNNSRNQLVRCESPDYGYKACSAPGASRAAVARQLSQAACIEGRTWGFNNSGIWVDHGCAAEFSVDNRGGYGYDNGNAYGRNSIVKCESPKFKDRRCPADTSRGVQLARQLSQAACIQGQDWGYDRNSIWVRDGCAAEFQLGGDRRGRGRGRGYADDNYGVYNDNSRYGNDRYENDRYGNDRYGVERVRCESEDFRFKRCRANIAREVVLVRQLSEARCVARQSWGFDRDGIWVDRGCAAEFEVR